MRNILVDLKEKRLLPVAIALAVGAAAIPALLLKGGGTAPTAATAPAVGGTTGGAATAAQAIVTPADTQGDVSGSKPDPLVVFPSKNPFRQQAQGGGKAPTSGTTHPIGSGSTTGTGSTSSSGSTTGGGNGTTGTQTTTNTQPSKIKLYRWAVNLQFGVDNKLHKHKDLTSIEFFPSESNPVATLLGVTQNGGAAIFMLSEGVSQGGEGTCKPSKAACTFLYLRTDKDKNRHTVYRDPSRKYTILLDRIDLKATGKTVTGSGASAKQSSRSGGSSRKRVSVPFSTVIGKR